MRVCILAYDGLDYYLVRDGDYPNLKQAEHGLVDISGFTLSTYVLWASFITGLEQTQHKVRFLWKFIPERLYSFLAPKVERILDKFSMLRREVIGIADLWHTKEDFRRKGIKTIFDYAKRPVAISIPSYNESETDIWIALRTDFVSGHEEALRFMKYIWKVHEDKKREVLRRLREEEWDLFMAWFALADLVGHLLWYDEEQMTAAYRDLDEFAGLVRDLIPEDTLLLIVSDHGTIRDRHVPYAFYSSNIRLGLERPRITSFFRIVISALRGELMRGGPR